MSTADSRNRAVERRQWLLFAVAGGAVAVLFVLWMGGGGGSGPAPLGGIEAELATAGDAEANWVRRSETRLGGIETRLMEVERNNRQLADENTRLRARLGEDAEDALQTIERQAALIDQLSQGVAPEGAGAVPENPFAAAAAAGQSAGAAQPTGAGQVAGAAQRDTPGPVESPSLAGPGAMEFELENPRTRSGADALSESTPVPKPTAAYLPAGSYAEAVVIAGADASAAVQSQGDPRPVLLRITSPAYGAAVDGIASRSDIEGCTVTGAAYGDLSSEKVYVRLQTMACAGEHEGTVVETPVSGYVAGAGAAGVRGAVVSREGALVEKAFYAGVFSGFGQSATQAFSPQAVLAGGGAATIANTGIEDIGRAGLGSGIGTAGQQVSDYLIRRAEQYQPVIQLAAGTPVTVVFIEGSWLDGRTAANGAIAQ